MYLCVYYTVHGLNLGLGHMEKICKKCLGAGEVLRAGIQSVNIQ